MDKNIIYNIIEKYGWFGIYEENIYYTVNIPETWNCKNFEIILPELDEKIAHAIFTTLVDRIKAGERFESGQYYSQILKDYNILIMETNKRLRIIIPNENGEFVKDSIFAAQWEGLS